MPLRFSTNINSSPNEFILNNIEYIKLDDYRYFKLNDSKERLEIRVHYIPVFESDRDPERYECFLFENPYLTAENDIFQVYESTLDGRLGWIFPISALDSNDNDYAEDNSFKHYRHIAYRKLLTLDYKISNIEYKDKYQISELFHGVTICILSKDEISKIEDFRITNYFLSLLKYDYLVLKSSFKGKKSFKKENEIDVLRKGTHKIKVKRAAFDISKNQYTTSLFIDHVYQTENVLTKYILLYQILEQFIQKYGDKLVDEIISEYKENRINKNSLKEKIVRIQNDRSLIKEIFKKTVIKEEYRNIFMERCKFLFSDINLSLHQNLEDAVYDLRNLITHNYRLLTDKEEELNELIYSFEQVILDLLIGLTEMNEEREAN